MSAPFHRSGARRKALLPALLGLLLATPCVLAKEGLRFLVNYSDQPGSCAGFDHVILDPTARFDPRDPQAPTSFAYLSVVEIAPEAPYLAEARKGGLVLDAPGNKVWNSKLADLANPAWTDFVVQDLAARANQRGFDGFFLDTADSIALLPGAGDESRRATYRDHLAALITKLHKTYPAKPIILNRGFEVLDHLPAGTVQGVLIESVFQTYDFGKKTYMPATATDTTLLTERIKSLRKQDLQVYVIDYVDPVNPVLARETARRIEELGAAALVTTPDLTGTVLAPSAPLPRKILVLYGHDKQITGQYQIWPSDTEVARQFQPVLEWMGYDLRFHSVEESDFPDLSTDDYAGLILDTGIAMGVDKELALAGWLLKQKDRGLKLLVCGTYPFQSTPARDVLFKGLGINRIQSGSFIPQNVRITHKDAKLCDFERDITPRSREFIDAPAPRDATSFLTLLCEDRRGVTRTFDPVYAAPWGGAVLHPYWNFQPSFNDSYSYIDTVALLQHIFPGGAFPAPDTTTRDGLRLFWAHIDGDGFPTLSNLKRNTTCAEIVRDRIINKYPLPTTVSVIEAEIRALQTTQDPASAGSLTALAREILALPQVEAASHAYSHPFVWSSKDVSPHDRYQHRCLLLHPDHDHPEVDPHREVVGSVEYIERELLPPGKKVRIMLWSGNCRPFPEAIRYTRELGIENMNGGFTVHSKRHPQLSAIAPRGTWWDDELQIYAGNQNDYVYTNDWTGPTYGGFENVIDSFVQLDSPRRMKPVNVYYHFYSGAHAGSMAALERIHDWVMEQSLHPVTASEAASLTRGAFHAEIQRTGPKRWLLTNQGSLTTFRIPKSLGYPDLAASTNITGYNDHLTERYIHTNGAPFAELVLAETPVRHLHLRSSEATITFATLAADHCSFQTTALRPAELAFGGLAPDSAWTLSYADKAGHPASSALQADKDGLLRFTLPHSTQAAISPASTTASR